MKKIAAKKSKVRKVLVRNAILPARTCQVEGEKRVQFSKPEEEDDDGEELASGGKQNDFSSPEFCTILKLADEIRKLKLEPSTHLGKKFSKASVPCNLNFELDEKLFNDLVSLERPNAELRTSEKPTSSFRGARKKDIEPNYEELLKYSLQPEYKFTRLYIPEVKKPTSEFDGRSMFRLSKRWQFYDTEYV